MFRAFLCAAALVATSPTIAMSASGAEAVRCLYDTLLANMQSGPALGVRGRYLRITLVVERVFDVQFMTRLAVGPEWERLNDLQRKQVNEASDGISRRSTPSGSTSMPESSCASPARSRRLEARL
jgi:hypothetical protein